jgi:DNA-binding NtrC family response regulator
LAGHSPLRSPPERQLETKRRAFREDLYYRINVVHLVIPPLRERREYIAPPLEYYLRVASENAGGRPCSITPDAMTQLCAYRWPGNIRELRNLAERIALSHSGRSLAEALAGTSLDPCVGRFLEFRVVRDPQGRTSAACGDDDSESRSVENSRRAPAGVRIRQGRVADQQQSAYVVFG